MSAFGQGADVRGMAYVCSVVYAARFSWRYIQSSLPLSIIKMIIKSTPLN